MRDNRIAIMAGLALAVAALCPPAGTLWAKAPKLPPTAPLPAPSEAPLPPEPSGAAAPQQPPAEAPLPAPRPADAPDADKVEPPATAPAPPEKPVQHEDMEEQEKPAGPESKVPAPDPRSAETASDHMPPEESACRARLKVLGVDFGEREPEHDPAVGCSLPYPVTVRTLGKAIALAPDAELNCSMAEAAARFLTDVVDPAARAEFGSGVKSVEQASAFVCRPRHNGEKLSEHAFGNALDIAAFTLDDGTKIEIGPAPPEKQAKFLDRVRKAACGPFKTVLGPGSDPDHARHFHLDLEPRRHGGTFCQ